MVHKWFTEFQCGRTRINDARPSGRLIEVTTEEMMNKIHDIVLANRRVKVREIVEIVNSSDECVGNISYTNIWAWKICARGGCRVCYQRIKNAIEWSIGFITTPILPDKRTPKKAKTLSSAGKVMVAVF